MNKIFVLALCLCSFVVQSAILDFSGTSLGVATNRAVLVRPAWLNPTNSIGFPDARIYRTGTNGSFSISNVPESVINFEVLAPPSSLTFSIYVEDTTNRLDVATLRGLWTGGRLSPNSYAWSAKAADARYWRKDANASVTNINNATGTGVNLSGSFTATGGNVVTNNQTGVTLSGTFSGNGSGLTNIGADSLSSGTIPDGRLSTNVVTFFAGKVYAPNGISATGPEDTFDLIGIPSGTLASVYDPGIPPIDNVAVSWSGTHTMRGTFSGNAAGLTNLPPSAIVGGWSGIVTNWGDVGFSNRIYYANGIVTNVTQP